MRVFEDLPYHHWNTKTSEPWSLRVRGLVSKPFSLSIEQVQSLPKRSLTLDFTCEEGWTVKGLSWEGVALASILQLAKLRNNVRSIQVSSGDFEFGLNLEKAREQTTILALKKNGVILDKKTGGPVRLVFPDQICYSSVKSVDSITAVTEEAEGNARRIATARISRTRELS